ncbi:MAG: Anaerobic nitric oxide reductase transcription regulator NorR [bacterium]|nr:Anaerobic nitric oxide reductase transcription regulator NorR [bacterium]
MIHLIRKIEFGLLLLILLIVILALLPLPLTEALENSLIDLQFKLRGPRHFGDEFVFVFIGAEEAQTLGGWPLTRDYYGYMTHVLQRLGAKVIGFDILFDTPNRSYPEFDHILADFLQSAGNVCLPMTFAELSPDPIKTNQTSPWPGKILSGHNPTLPFAQLAKQAAGIGFSNFTPEPVTRQAPLVAVDHDSVMFSFGVELARLYWGKSHALKITSTALMVNDVTNQPLTFPLDRYGRLRLNHFGDLAQVSALGFVDLLKTFERAPDSLNFTDKIVLVAATLPGAPTLKATPLSDALPAALIHATVAENLIHQNFLREWPVAARSVLIILMAVAGWWVWRVNRLSLRRSLAGGILLLYWVVAALLFRYSNLIWPLFYPTLAYLVALTYAGVMQQRQRRSGDESLQQLLQAQIELKETQLAEAQNKFAETQKLFLQQTLSSAQARELAEARQQKIFALENELRDLRTHVVPETPAPAFAEIVHAPNGKMAQVLSMVAKLGAADIPVLILGETGTGKELIARAIHQSGKRKHAPFVAVNCGALPETLLESELFGHEKGSFTGASARRRGRFELADNGTIFLDEISETTPAFQARLLRVLQEGTFERVGGEATLKVDVRVMAASNQNLPTQVEKGNFRADLFYRLNGFPMTLPALRERREDIALLLQYFLQKYANEVVTGFSDRAMEILTNYHWPGNVRELENVVRRAAILAQSESRRLVQIGDLPKEMLESESSPQAQVVYQPLEEQILEMLRALKFSRSAISQTAKALGNRDRGTITEYFRGLCFEYFVRSNFAVEKAAQMIAATDDADTIERVRHKMEEYLANIQLVKTRKKEAAVLYKGLPKKYHSFLQQVIAR